MRTLTQALGIGVGAAVGQYAGIHLLIPLVATAAVWWTGTRLLPAGRNVILPTLAINAGQCVWLSVALALRGGLTADVADPIVHAIGLAWLVARPGVGPLYFLGAYQVVALAVNVPAFIDAAAGSEMHKALLVALIWRALSLIAIGRLWFTLRQRSKTGEATTA